MLFHRGRSLQVKYVKDSHSKFEGLQFVYTKPSEYQHLAFLIENPCGILIGSLDGNTQGFSSQVGLGVCSCSAAHGGLPNHYVGTLQNPTDDMSAVL